MRKETIIAIEDLIKRQIEGNKIAAMDFAIMDDKGIESEKRINNELCAEWMRKAHELEERLEEFREFVKGASDGN